MKTQKKHLLVGIVALFVLISIGCNNSKNTIRYTKVGQQGKNLCWAATSQIIAEKLNIKASQCDIIRNVHPSYNCCNTNTSCYINDKCDVLGNIHEPLKSLGVIGCYYREPDKSIISFDWIRNKIDAGQILAVMRKNGLVQNHWLVIVGYKTKGEKLILFDPFGSKPCLNGSEINETYSSLFQSNNLIFLGFDFKKIIY